MSDEAAATNTYFLSYSRSDERFALRLAKDLRARKVTMWVDQLDIRPSEHWDRAIERAVRNCRGIVVVLSPRSVASDNVADEISFAIDSGKSVLPVMIEKCVLPLRITRMHLIDATGSYDKALQQCLAELASPANARPGADVREPKPVASLRQDVLLNAKRQLAEILGPIANVLVDKAASRAASAGDLYGQLAQHITGDEDRARFLAMAPEPPEMVQPSAKDANSELKGSHLITTPEIEAISNLLTTYLGPIAPILAKRESRKSRSLQDLKDRLAALVPERHRAEFLRRLEARS
jgi:hypothetical protein